MCKVNITGSKYFGMARPLDWTVHALHISFVLLNVILKSCAYVMWRPYLLFGLWWYWVCVYRVTQVDKRLRIHLWMVCMCISCWSCTSQTFLLFITSTIICLWCSFTPFYPKIPATFSAMHKTSWSNAIQISCNCHNVILWNNDWLQRSPDPWSVCALHKQSNPRVWPCQTRLQGNSLQPLNIGQVLEWVRCMGQHGPMVWSC